MLTGSVNSELGRVWGKKQAVFANLIEKLRRIKSSPGEINFTLEQIIKTQRESTGITLLFL